MPEPKPSKKTAVLIGEADAIYSAATVNAEAELNAAMKESQATFKDDVIDVNKLEERIRAALKEVEAIFDDDVIGYETLLIARKAIAGLSQSICDYSLRRIPSRCG